MSDTKVQKIVDKLIGDYSEISQPINLEPKKSGKNLGKILECKFITKSTPVFKDIYYVGNITDRKSSRSSLTSARNISRNSRPAIEIENIKLPSRPSHPPPLHPSIYFYDNSWLPKELNRLLNIKEKMYPPSFKFLISNESEKFNFSLLKKHDFDLEKLLNPEKICVTNYGSELKSVEELDNLWMKHPRWKTLSATIW